MPSTSRLSIPYPAGSDPVDVNGDLQSVAEALDDAALADQGLLSARPAAGLMGRLYRATDDGKVYWDTGSAWVACSAATATADLDDEAVTAAKIADGTITPAKLSAGITSAAKSIIAGSESRTNTAYGTLTTPDQAAGIALPSGGLIVVAYQALWSETVQGAARAAIFLGSTQMQATQASNASAAQETVLGNGTQATSQFVPLATNGYGLGSASNISSNSGYPATGHAVGAPGAAAPVLIFADAGTYTVSVRFKATSGTVTAKERRLWAWAMSF